MNNTEKGKELEVLIKNELLDVIKKPYVMVDNNLGNDPYITQMSKVHSLGSLYKGKSFIRGDFLIYKSLSDMVMIDAKNYKNKATIEKTVDVNKAFIFLTQNISYITELGHNINKLQDLIYRPSKNNGKVECIGKISKKSFQDFINFLENGTIHHHSSEYLNQVRIKKYFIYQVNNEKYSVCSFKELSDKKISVSIRNGENSQRIIFKQNDLVLCELNSSNNHMSLHHHSVNMMETKNFDNLRDCIVYIEDKYSFSTKEISYESVLKIIEKKEVVSKKSLAIELMLKNISLQNINKIFEKIDSCKKILSLSEKYVVTE